MPCFRCEKSSQKKTFLLASVQEKNNELACKCRIRVFGVRIFRQATAKYEKAKF
ncbi:MAG: hypothetical protein AVDCRST_MAG74-2724 [uncultured Pyrinomonadaceae bacterium]|uniref:Uncharacterized protein n=1 Tax=uncultured Pyrinomonadaceae bacterium TaxID=2283094 RepID=A0A6J4PJC5_9BACT|nr:MAG: hypothetical protein AVDCRST_MAG74-2724 [uncultured Pyrinomonadaceae bacterium]